MILSQIGEKSGFKINATSWTIRDLMVETGHWYAAKEVLITTGKITRISYEESKVWVNLTKADIQRTLGNEAVKAVASTAP